MNNLGFEWWKLSAKMEAKFEWSKVKIIPPFACAIIRFLIRKKGSEKRVSVYLDCYDQLAAFGASYWEVYPVRGDVERIAMNDINGLLKAIKSGLKEK